MMIQKIFLIALAVFTTLSALFTANATFRYAMKEDDFTALWAIPLILIALILVIYTIIKSYRSY